MGDEKEYLSLEEVPESLGVTYQLIYRLVRTGDLPAARLGKLYRGKPARVLPRYVADTLGRYHDLELDDIFITHSGIEGQLVELVRAAIEEQAHFERIHVTQASCTISSHCGPNTLGILFTTKSACA